MPHPHTSSLGTEPVRILVQGLFEKTIWGRKIGVYAADDFYLSFLFWLLANYYSI